MHGQGLYTPTHGTSPLSHLFPRVTVRALAGLVRRGGPAERICFPSLLGRSRLDHGVFPRSVRVGGREPAGGPAKAAGSREGTGTVAENLGRIKEALGAGRVLGMRQQHGTVALSVGDEGVPPEAAADALITARPGVALLVKQADCQAVVLYDPDRSVIANVHCGWRGNVGDILGKTVARMQEAFGCRPSRLVAAVSPALGPCCAEFKTYWEIFPEHFQSFRVGENHFDLRAISCMQLTRAGLPQEHIEIADVCTACRTDLFYSYRREGKTGRFATVVMMKDGA